MRIPDFKKFTDDESKWMERILTAMYTATVKSIDQMNFHREELQKIIFEIRKSREP